VLREGETACAALQQVQVLPSWQAIACGLVFAKTFGDVKTAAEV